MNKINIKIGIIGGSGLDDPNLFENFNEKEADTPYGKPSSKLVIGKLKGVDVVFLARHGQDHSIMPTHVPYQANIWALKEAGCTHILATTACGSLRAEIKPGDFVFLDQFIDNTKHRILTLYEDKVVHTPMAEPFCKKTRATLIKTAEELNLNFHPKGAMISIEGPRFSTKAESRMFRLWGADTINMSTVPEVILAREAGICYVSIAMSTDYDCWKDDEEPVTWEMVFKRMRENSDNVKKLIVNTIAKIKISKCCG